MDTDRLDRILLDWAHWMRSREMACFHVKAGSVGVGFTHYSMDRDSEYAKSDAWVSVNTDAVIRDLKRLEQEALAVEYLHMEWTAGIDIGLVLVVAREGVRMGLNRRGIV